MITGCQQGHTGIGLVCIEHQRVVFRLIGSIGNDCLLTGQQRLRQGHGDVQKIIRTGFRDSREVE